jgi:5-methylcytosine-specific restriction endonuclease McrA
MSNKKEHIFISGIELKQCAKCRAFRNIDCFRKDKGKWDKLYPYCKYCAKEKDHKVYMKNPQRKCLVVKEYMKKTGNLSQYKYYSSKKSRLKKRARDLKRRILKKKSDLYCKIDDKIINSIIIKYNCKCAYCEKECKDVFHIDHKIPLSRGGDNSINNLALSCPYCNFSKSNKTDIEFIGHAV